MSIFSKQVVITCSLSMLCLANPIQSIAQPAVATIQQNKLSKVIAIQKLNATTVDIVFENNSRMTIDFYGDHIFRVFQDHKGIIRNPSANPPAQILADNPRQKVSSLSIENTKDGGVIQTKEVRIDIVKETGLLSVTNLSTGKKVISFVEPPKFEKNKVQLILNQQQDEYFYGGGVQNGRFSHKGKIISIENQNSWTDGGVASPNPFYWSTGGYGLLWHTFKKGKYDFGSNHKGQVSLYHETDYLDVFFMVNTGAVNLLKDFYQLTGNPILIPKFGFYQGHLNAYNRDYWKEDEKGILFEDGKRYKESQKDNGGIKESLNGELPNNYQFSARAVIDRYKNHDMPLGWILPNDGYGAGYGQTSTLDSNILNLKSFGDYARQRGVEIGLWTQSDLHPKDSISALLQRDIVKEVRDAGVRVLKTDVAWVGPGYSFGLNGVADVGHIMPYYGNNDRPFIISLDGWAGTQRYATIWSGDQTGGNWEYIRFHIPTYIGSGLSGNPNITSDMDGIFGGKNVAVNVRDFQWKTWTPMQLNMDGWGSNEKYPHALGEVATSINRNYLKLKSQLMPYAYSISKTAVSGMPMIRAMFLEYPNTYTQGIATQYQFLYGPSFLVAPIYQATKADDQGNDIRNGIYLPEGSWIDYFTGEKYEGNRIINSFEAPLWKLPVFVKAGSIIPMTNAHNNVYEINNAHRIYEIYPAGSSEFVEYDDDGRTEAYRYNEGISTRITSVVDAKNNVTIHTEPTLGTFNGFVKNKSTEYIVNVTARPKKVSAKIGNKNVKLVEVYSLADFFNGENVYFYESKPNLNQFSTKGSEFEKVEIIKNPQVRVKLSKTDVTESATSITLSGYEFAPANSHLKNTGNLAIPTAQISEENTEAYVLKPTWAPIPNADYYEIEFEGNLYSTIKDTVLTFDGLKDETEYTFKIRAVNKEGVSEWTSVTKTTKSNPLQFAISGISATTTAENQGGHDIGKLFDFDEGNLWHTKWGTNAVPFDLVMDLKSFNQLEKFHYVPRENAGNGNILKGKVYYSLDGENWTDAGPVEWAKNSETKIFDFKGQPTARYIKLSVTEGTGGFGSGRELYVFKVPGTESYLPGDINNDRVVDANDLTSYLNYTGLRKTDADFEYVSIGDLNKNGLIDAYDISVVATQLNGGVTPKKDENIGGSIAMHASKTNLKTGEMVEVLIKGRDLKGLNGISFAFPYSSADYEYVGVESLGTLKMDNFTNDRLHSNGTKSLYPTFVNVGDKDTVSGNVDLFVIKLRAKKATTFNLKMLDGILVDKQLKSIKF